MEASVENVPLGEDPVRVVAEHRGRHVVLPKGPAAILSSLIYFHFFNHSTHLTRASKRCCVPRKHQCAKGYRHSKRICSRRRIARTSRCSERNQTSSASVSLTDRAIIEHTFHPVGDCKQSHEARHHRRQHTRNLRWTDKNEGYLLDQTCPFD